MAVATWVGGDGTGSEQTDYGRAANWSGGVVPDADDHVIVANTGHNCKLDANREAASLTVNSGATIDGSGAKLSIKSEGDSSEGTNGYAVNLIGIVSGNLDLEIDTPATTNLDIIPSSGNIRNLIIDLGDAARVAKIQTGGPTLTGNLTITSGQLSTENNALTVAEKTSVNGGTLTCGSGTMSFGASYTADYALEITGGTFVGGSGTHTLGSLYMSNTSAAVCTLTSGVTTISSEVTSANYAINITGTNAVFNHGSGTVTITTATDSRITNAGADLALNNLIINHASADITLASNGLTCAGNLTITAGKLNTGVNKALTVGTDTDDGGATGHLRIKDDGELVCNSSTVIVGSVYCQIAAGSNGTGFAELNLPDASGSFTVRGPEVSSYVFRLDNQAECNHNGGTVTFSLTAENHPSIMDVTSLRGTGVNNILVTQSVRTPSTGGVLEFVGSDHIKGNLTLTGNGSQSCIVDTNFNGASLTVDGNVTVNNHATLMKRTTNTGNYSFGGLEIASGGTYNATSGITTITDKISSGTYTNYMFQNAGTFTHNKGTVHWKADTSSGTWYAMNGSTSATQTEFYNISTERVRASGTEQYRFWTGGSARHLTVLNNIDIGANTRIFSSNGTGNFRNDGICDISGILNIVNVTTVNMGTVTIESGGELEFADGNTVNVESIRNVGGTVTVT